MQQQKAKKHKQTYDTFSNFVDPIIAPCGLVYFESKERQDLLATKSSGLGSGANDPKLATGAIEEADTAGIGGGTRAHVCHRPDHTVGLFVDDLQ